MPAYEETSEVPVIPSFAIENAFKEKTKKKSKKKSKDKKTKKKRRGA